MRPTLNFIWQETLLELRRERLIAVTTITTVAVLFLLLGANLLFISNLRLWAQRAENEVQLSAYYQKTLDRSTASDITRTIATWPEVQDVKFVTREERWQDFSTKVPDASKLRGLDATTFPDSVDLHVKSPSVIPKVIQKLEAIQEIKDVVPNSQENTQSSTRTGRLIRDIVRVNRLVRVIGMCVAFLVAIVGIFVVHNTIRLALHARWREIYIMQLVGATRTLIAAPFMLQGAIQGLIGAALAACILVPVHLYLDALVVHSGRLFLRLQPQAVLLHFGVNLLLGGILLGLLGSALSIRRTLRHTPEWQT